MKDLSPPAHIIGRLLRNTPKSIIEDRRAWIVDRRNDGHKFTGIANALGVSTTSVEKAIKNGNSIKRRKLVSRLEKVGIGIGSIGNAMADLPIDQMSKVIDLAILGRCTVSEALIRYYIKTSVTNAAK